MKGDIDQPKTFISYSWSDAQHEQWVVNLAERLSNDGVVVILDKWDLKAGQDKHAFMEAMVNDTSIKKVLVICDSVYQEKANQRKGGVGTETQLISKELYEKTDQEKFIPIIKELSKEGKPCIPTYMGGRIHIDLSSSEKFEENYQKLVRNLYDKPLFKKPPLGLPPSYITDDEQIILKTSHKISEIKNALINGKSTVNGLISDYLKAFIEQIRDFELSEEIDPEFDEKVVESINKMIPLRDDFIDFISTVFNYQASVDLDRFKDFFEELIPFCDPHPKEKTRYDNYKVFIYELTLNFTAKLLQMKRYKEVAYFLNQSFFYYHPITNQLSNAGIEIFNQQAKSLDEIRNNRLDLKRLSLTADLIKEHSIRDDIKFNEIMQADLILYYITLLQEDKCTWFPQISIYHPRGNNIEIFEKMISLNHFEKIKEIFDVESINQLKKMLRSYIEKNRDDRGYTGLSGHDMRPIENIIKIDEIGKIK